MNWLTGRVEEFGTLGLLAEVAERSADSTLRLLPYDALMEILHLEVQVDDQGREQLGAAFALLEDADSAGRRIAQAVETRVLSGLYTLALLDGSGGALYLPEDGATGSATLQLFSLPAPRDGLTRVRAHGSFVGPSAVLDQVEVVGGGACPDGPCATVEDWGRPCGGGCVCTKSRCRAAGGFFQQWCIACGQR